MLHIAKQIFKKLKSHHKLNWLSLETESGFKEILSSEKPIAVFKHSTRCAISSMAKNRLEKSWESVLSDVPVYLLDVIENRSLSSQIADQLHVTHQSPQLLLIKNGEAIYDASHSSISAKEVARFS